MAEALRYLHKPCNNLRVLAYDADLDDPDQRLVVLHVIPTHCEAPVSLPNMWREISPRTVQKTPFALSPAYLKEIEIIVIENPSSCNYYAEVMSTAFTEYSSRYSRIRNGKRCWIHCCYLIGNLFVLFVKYTNHLLSLFKCTAPYQQDQDQNRRGDVLI